jgi:hypothetical protein
MLISRRALNTPLLVSCGFLFLFGGIALASRFRVSSTINAIFKSGLGGEYQSWFEHFLSGFASPSLLFISAVLFGYALSRGREGNTSIRVVLRIRSWLLSQSERRVYIFLVGACAFLYMAASGDWEFNQFQERGIFQVAQFGSDVAGSVIWFLLLKRLCPNPSLQGTLRLSAARP